MRVKIHTSARVQKEAKEIAEARTKLRLDVCKGCPFYTEIGACKKCGCFMPVKATFKNAKCPLGKW